MLKLLIIDSNEAFKIEQLIDWKKYGFGSVKTAKSFQESIKKISDFKPHVILVNLKIDDKFAYDLMEDVTNIALHTSFIVMSESNSFEYVRKCFLAGAKDFLLKPLSKEQLDYTVNNIINEKPHDHYYLSQNTNVNDREEHLKDPILDIEYIKLSPLINKIIFIVKTNYKYDLDLTVLGDRLKMNSKYIGRLFLKETNMKFSHYLKCYRMYEAKHLIKTTTQTISSIAESVGYKYPNMFYLHFKEVYNFSPTELRREKCSTP